MPNRAIPEVEATLTTDESARGPSGTSPPRRRLGPALALAALLPMLSVLGQAWSVSPSGAYEPSAPTKRELVLRELATNDAALINVTAEDMPASPDILNLGKRSTRALERCLADNADAGIRAGCAAMIHALGDRRALATLHAALDDWDPGVRLEVISALGAMPDKSSVEPLLKLLRRQDEEPQNRIVLLQALGAMSDQRAVRVLRAELANKRGKAEDEGQDLRPEAFSALWTCRHLMARGTLEGDVAAALASDNDALVLTATEAAAELRAPRLVSALVPLMEHSLPDVRNKAVYALGRIGDKTATKALLAALPQVRDGRMLNNIAFALERLDKTAFYSSIERVIGHKQAVIRLNAAFVLGDVRRPDGLPMLRKALADPSDFVRTSAIVAVGKLGITKDGAAEARKTLEPFVDDPSLNVRQEAIYALHALTEGGRADLLHDRLFKQLDPRTQAEAIRRAAIALGKAGDERVRDYLLACLESYRCSFDDVSSLLQGKPSARTSNRLLVAWARGRGDLASAVSELRPAGGLPVATGALDSAWARRNLFEATRAVDVIGSLGDSSARPVLAAQVGSPDTWVRIHALVAVARLGDADASKKLLAEIENLPTQWLPRFVRVVSAIREPAARALLSPELERLQSSPEPAVALAAAAIRLRWDPETAIFRFLDALASPLAGERDLAEHYLARNRDEKVTWLLRRALARETRESARDRLRTLLEQREQRV